MYDAVYARQSVYKAASISIETQIEMAEAVCKNPVKYYRDAGFSGKNVQRPAYINLMQDIKNGLISKVVVYKMDRFSRSLLDFTGVWEFMAGYGVEFISVTENFDTSTPMGKAMLFIMAVFAQLEREQIAERVTDNYFARARLGSWAGGPPPYGFDITSVMSEQEKRSSSLIPNGNMEIVKRIYEEYMEPMASLGKVKTILNNEGIAGPQNTWSTVALKRVLSNPAYVKMDANIYNYYKNNGVVITSSLDSFIGVYGGLLVGKTKAHTSGPRSRNAAFHMRLSSGNWEGVIEPKLFLKCQEKLKSNRQIGKNGAGTYSWLSGLIKCGECHYALTISTYTCTSGEVRRYFGCSGKYIKNACDANRFPAVIDTEKQVQEELQAELNKCKDVEVETQVNNSIQIELVKIDEEIQNLMSIFKREIASDATISFINNEIDKLYKKQMELMELQEPVTGFVQYEKVDFETLSLEDKKKVAYTYIKKVLVYSDSIAIEWKI